MASAHVGSGSIGLVGGQWLRSLLSAEDDLAGPVASINMNGPVEAVLRKSLRIFATALAMLKLAHLLCAKRFVDKLISTAVAVV